MPIIAYREASFVLVFWVVYPGDKLDKMPDILIGLTDRLNVFRLSQDWLFIECKPVDSNHSAGVHYCDRGILRFVRGEYAWAMTSALMIGYISNGYSIVPLLVNALSKRMKEVLTVEFPSVCPRSKPGKNSEAVHISQHLRLFRYIETGQQAPAITLRHLWLRRD